MHACDHEAKLGLLLLGHLDPELCRNVGSLQRIEQILQDAIELARRTFPEVPLELEPFFAFLAERIPHRENLEQALLELRVADLFLACACLERVPEAVARFEREFLVDIGSTLTRMETASFQVEDLKQMVCQKLLIGDEGHPPRLSRYAGTGDLRSWLCVVAVRMGLDLLRREKATTPLDDGAMADAVAPDEDQELQYLKRLYRNEFKEAFEEALSTLTSRERNILRHQVLDGLTLEQIGAVYNVHRATVARWNARLRRHLLKHTRRVLLARLNTSMGEFESIMRLIQSQLDVSIRRYLTRADAEP